MEPDDYVKNFFLLDYVATHSRKLHRSYGDLCINPLGDTDVFVNIPEKIWHSLRPLYVFLCKNTGGGAELAENNPTHAFRHI